MSFAKPKIEAALESLVALGRACGVHIIVATQRPSVDVLGGVIKANFPCRIAFQVSSATDSQVILGKGGAELLLGRGDMLFQSGSKIQRVHGAFVSDDEVETAVRRMRDQGCPDYRFGARIDCNQASGPNDRAKSQKNTVSALISPDFLFLCCVLREPCKRYAEDAVRPIPHA